MISIRFLGFGKSGRKKFPTSDKICYNDRRNLYSLVTERERVMEAVSYSRKVNYYETDQMGIVHHSNYIRYFEEARMDMMETLGLSHVEIEKAGLFVPVMFVDCRYLQPLRFGDRFEVQTKMTKFDGIKMELVYEIYREDGGILCTAGRSGHCFLDKEMKPVRMKRYYPDVYQRLKEIVR